MMTTFLVYKNGSNEVKPYEVEMPADRYAEKIEVYDVRAGKEKTFYTDAILEETTTFEEATKRAEELQTEWLGKEVRHGRLSDFERKFINFWDKPSVFFTGFKKAEKAELEAMAEEAGMWLAPGIGPRLTVLIGGPNAGPSKIASAGEYNIPCILGRERFEQFLKTGELPDRHVINRWS